jgi:Flp pilus assembly protein TadD
VEVFVFMFRPRSLVVAIFVVALGTASSFAGDLHIPLPKKSKYTPVQKLNRDGVTAVEKHQYDKAKKLFYKAYLIDPDDPFTLNNLGYLAELNGDADRAERYYQLASEQNSDAVIDKASNDRVEGKPVSAVAGNAEDKGIKINRLNNEAIALLEKDRAPEADLILQKALTIDARNPFTLNNLGYAKEKEGELDSAYQFYSASADTHSHERIEVAIDKDWRGKEISSVARNNARKLDKRMRDVNDIQSRVALLNLRGVSAMNRNDRRTARDLIHQAYKLDPKDAFTLNNMGYLAEMDGDRETADYYYHRAQDANSKGARITLATRKDVEGKKIGDLAENTDNMVQTQIEAEQEARRREGGPVILRRRNNTPVIDPAQPVTPSRTYHVSDANGNLILPPLHGNTVSQPIQPSGGLAMPLPDDQQPTTVHEGDIDHGMIMPLPDDQQPGTNPNTQPQQNPPQPRQGVIDNGVMMPLPDNRQPDAQPPNPATAAPPQAQSPAPQQGPGMLLPVPDSQQNQQPQTQSASPQSNIGVYTLPPVGAANNGTAKPLKKISDTDPAKPKAKPSTNGVKRITDQN